MLFGETVVSYCENHTEHTNTGNTLRLLYKAQPVNAVWGNSRCLHRYRSYLTGNILRLRYRAQPVNAN
jgi:hypothetical protein